MKKKVLILYGGISKERAISLETGKQVAKELKKKYSIKLCEPKDLDFSIKSFKGIPISSSTLHGELTFPDIQNIFVPVFFGFPIEANHLLPFLSIVGTTAIVSTLFTIVGQP